jgi:phosphotriesterase-related protein
MPNDATRINFIIGLIERGYRDKLLVSEDICHKTQLAKYGGDGYSHILENVLPMMRRKGMSDEDIDAITIHNPARILAFI